MPSAREGPTLSAFEHQGVGGAHPISFGHYDEPKKLRYAINSICPIGADGGQPTSSRTFGSAPPSISAAITAELSLSSAAMCRGVEPLSFQAFGSAPDDKQSRIVMGVTVAKNTAEFQPPQSAAIDGRPHAVRARKRTPTTIGPPNRVILRSSMLDVRLERRSRNQSLGCLRRHEGGGGSQPYRHCISERGRQIAGATAFLAPRVL